MGKALVIKNVDFGTNKLTTVTLQNEVPCTAISLNKSSTTLENIGTTETLTATVTPVNTTDTVVWASSNANIVDVVGGVLTVTGVGTVTITATCGNYSATCTVTATNEVAFDHYLVYRCYKGGSGDVPYGSLGASDSNNYAAGFKHTGTSTLLVANLTDASDHIYPIMLSNGTSKLTFDIPSTMRVTLWLTSTTTPSSQYSYYVGVISGDASPWDSSVALGDREVTVPSGADSFIFTLQYPNNAVTDEIVAGITITES